MKRLLYFLILTGVITLIACNNNNEEITDSNSGKTELVETAGSAYNYKVESEIPAESKVTEAAPVDELEITYRDIYDKIASMSEIYYTYEINTDDFNAAKISGENIDAVTFSKDESDNLFAVLFYTYNRAYKDSSKYQSTVEAYDWLCEYLDESTYRTDKYEQDDNDIFYVIATGNDIDPETLPVSFKEYKNPDDFFNDDERAQTYENLLVQGDYSGLYDYMADYEKDHDRGEDRSLDESLNALNEILAISEGKVQVEYDKYENESTVYYSGVTDISQDCNIIPLYKTGSYGSTFKCRYGFAGKDWIFFETVYFAGDGMEPESIHFDLTDLKRDVIQSTGTVLESAEYAPPVEWKSGIIDRGIGFEPSIKLKGEKEVEYILDEKDIEAFTLLSKMESLHSTLYYLPASYDDI